MPTPISPRTPSGSARKGRHRESLASPTPLEPKPLGLVLFLALVVFPSLATTTWADAVPQGGEILVNIEPMDDQDTPTIVAGSNGSWVVVWESDLQDGSLNGVFLRHFDAAGGPTTGEIPVNETTDAEQEDPDIARLQDGSFIVVWDSDLQDGDARGIFGRRFDTAGQPVGGEFQVNALTTGDQNDPVVAAHPDGGFLVAWETLRQPPINEDVVSRRFDASGQGVGVELQINSLTNDDQEDLDLAADGNGGFVVAWESEGQDGSYDSVVVRRLDAQGAPVGDELLVNTFTEGDQDDPDVAVGPDGSFLVVWEDDTQDSLTDAIFGRWFDAMGNPVTDPIQLDTDPGRQMNPRAAIDSQGRGVVIWDSLDQDAAASIGIILNVFDASGNPLAPEQVVNTTTDGDQFYPHLAVGADDRVLTVWESTNADASGLGLVARRYELAFFADGFESGTTDAWSSVSP